MKRLLLACAAVAGLLSATPASADPVAWPSTVTAVVITTALTFQQVAPSQLTRHGCFVQNTSTDTEYVYLGPNGSATTGASVKLSAGASMSCGAGPTVAADALQITSATLNGATATVIVQ